MNRIVMTFDRSVRLSLLKREKRTMIKMKSERDLIKGVMKLKNSMTRVLWIIAGILLILSGVTLLLNPDVSLLSMAGMIGFVILLSGIFDLAIYFSFSKSMLGAGWQLLDGILGVIIGFMFLGNNVLVAAVLPYIFGMWILFSGVSKIVSGFDLKKLGFSKWGWIVALGVLMTGVGVISFCRPVLSAVALSALLAIGLIAEGVHAIFRGLVYRGFWL